MRNMFHPKKPSTKLSGKVVVVAHGVAAEAQMKFNSVIISFEFLIPISSPGKEKLFGWKGLLEVVLILHKNPFLSH